MGREVAFSLSSEELEKGFMNNAELLIDAAMQVTFGV